MTPKHDEQQPTVNPATNTAFETTILYRILFDNVPIGIALSTQDGRFLDCNAAMRQVTGYSDVELREIRLADLCLHPTERSRLLTQLQTEGSLQDYEIALRRRDTTPCFANLTVTPVVQGGETRHLIMIQDITQRKQAQDEARQRAESLQIASEMAIKFAAAPLDTDLFELIATQLKSITDAFATSVSTYDAQTRELTVRHVILHGPVLSRVNRLLGRSLVGMRMPVSPDVREEMLTGVVTVAEDLSEVTFGVVPKPAAIALQKMLGLGKFMGLALHYGDDLVGTSVVALPRGRKPPPADVMRVFAHIAAVSLRRRQAEVALHHYAERLRTLHALDGAILAAWSPEEIAQTALHHVRQLVPCTGAGVVTLDFETQEAILSAAHIDTHLGLGTGTRFPLEGAVEVEAFRQGKIVVEADIRALSQPPAALRALQAVGMRSYVAIPLIVDGGLIGLLALCADDLNAFSPEQVDTVHEVGNELAVALHQARLRAALDTERERLEALVEHLPEGILLLDSERHILLTNPAAQVALSTLSDTARVSARPPAVGPRVGEMLTHLAGHPIEKLLEPPREGAWHELEVTGPPRRVFELVPRPIAAQARTELSPALGEPNKARDWILVIRDVTEERDARRRAQQQEQLAALGQLAGGIAHDFNNILTAIILYAQLPLGQHELPSDVRHALETILSESHRAAKLVQQILDFSRQSLLDVSPVDLKSIVEESIGVLDRTLPDNVRISLEADPGKYMVDLDPIRIQQALVNLAFNARDAMPEGGELHVGLSRMEIGPGEKPPLGIPPGFGGDQDGAEMHPGKWVCLSVTDTGTGIPPEALPHIFEPFFTTKPPGEGPGLGLPQVYGIVKQHDGHIGVETRIGQGTTFRVYLPAYQNEEMNNEQ